MQQQQKESPRSGMEGKIENRMYKTSNLQFPPSTKEPPTTRPFSQLVALRHQLLP
jgi:hypothetical protein